MSSILKPKMISFRSDSSVSKGKAVKIGSDDQHVAVGAANTNHCIGISQSESDQCNASGALCEVAMPGGGAKVLLGETVVAGDDLVSHTDGTLVKPNASGDEIIARALEGGDATNLISAIVYLAKATAAE